MTIQVVYLSIFVLLKRTKLNQIKVIAFTHRQMNLDQIGWLHCDDSISEKRLQAVKSELNINEIVYLSTCNRVEFVLIGNSEINISFLSQFFKAFKPELTTEQHEHVIHHVEIHEGKAAAEHLFRVASSIDSMVIGEREIITQVRKAFENSRKNNLSCDYASVIAKSTIENAKRVYTETQIATKPVSVVSLAYHRLKDLNVPLDARVLIVGSGVTNTNMAKFLSKHGYSNFSVFNRTLENAQKLAYSINANSHTLEELKTYSKGFDILITCTGSTEPVITKNIYQNLLNGEEDKKIIIDLAVPKDTEKEVVEDFKVKYIDVEILKSISEQNLSERAKELTKVEAIIDESVVQFEKNWKQRELEIAMREVPNAIKNIKTTAINEVFAKDILEMDDVSRATLEKVISYMEKKYISVPIKMAKEILIEK